MNLRKLFFAVLIVVIVSPGLAVRAEPRGAEFPRDDQTENDLGGVPPSEELDYPDSGSALEDSLHNAEDIPLSDDLPNFDSGAAEEDSGPYAPRDTTGTREEPSKSGAPSSDAPPSPGGSSNPGSYPLRGDHVPGTALLATPDLLARIHQSNQKAIQLGHLAIERGESPELRSFGARLARDHAYMDRAAVRLMAAAGVDLAATVARSDMDRALINADAMDFQRLQHSADFDRDFLRQLRADHGSFIQMLSAPTGPHTSSDVQDFAARFLPILEQHRDLASGLVETLEPGQRK
jgi:predicted outer membrane protein